jgi:carboxymethylenebutenolidase
MVAFYGRQPALDLISRIKAKLQLHYALLDERVNVGIPDFVAAIVQYSIHYDMINMRRNLFGAELSTS